MKQIKQSRQCTGPSQLAWEHFCLISISSGWAQLAAVVVDLLWWLERKSTPPVRPQQDWAQASGDETFDKTTWKTRRIRFHAQKHITAVSSKNRTIFLITTVMNIIIKNLFSPKQNQINVDMCLHVYTHLPSVNKIWGSPPHYDSFC